MGVIEVDRSYIDNYAVKDFALNDLVPKYFVESKLLYNFAACSINIECLVKFCLLAFLHFFESFSPLSPKQTMQ